MTGTLSFGTSNAVRFQNSLIQKTMRHFMDTSNTPVVVDPKETREMPNKAKKELGL